MFRRACVAFGVAAMLATSMLAAPAAHAAPSGGQPIVFTFPQATFFSVLDGPTNSSAKLAGSINAEGTQLSNLSGTFNLPNKDGRLEASQTGSIVKSTAPTTVFWSTPQCIPACFGTSTFNVTTN